MHKFVSLLYAEHCQERLVPDDFFSIRIVKFDDVVNLSSIH